MDLGKEPIQELNMIRDIILEEAQSDQNFQDPSRIVLIREFVAPNLVKRLTKVITANIKVSE